MFARIAVVSTLAVLVMGNAVPRQLGNCNTGPVQCCDSLENADSNAGAALLSLLGISAQDVTGQIGLQCNPVTVIGGATGTSCKAEPVCCQNNNLGGLASVGCVPISL